MSEAIGIPEKLQPLVERMRRMALERDRLTAMLDGDVQLLNELMAAGGGAVPDGYVLRNLDVGWEAPPTPPQPSPKKREGADHGAEQSG